MTCPPVLDLPFRAWTLSDLGMVQQLTGDYPAAAASHQQALELFRDLGFRLVLIAIRHGARAVSHK